MVELIFFILVVINTGLSLFYGPWAFVFGREEEWSKANYFLIFAVVLFVAAG